MQYYTILSILILPLTVSALIPQVSRAPPTSGVSQSLESGLENVQAKSGHSPRPGIICTELEEDVRKRETVCNCPNIYAPVCGSDGVTYHNRCFINCVAKAQADYPRFKPLTIVKMAECGDMTRS